MCSSMLTIKAHMGYKVSKFSFQFSFADSKFFGLMVLYKCGEIQVQFFDSVVLQLNKFNYMVIAGKKNTILY